jgi:hypothetical protein
MIRSGALNFADRQTNNFYALLPIFVTGRFRSGHRQETALLDRFSLASISAIKMG